MPVDVLMATFNGEKYIRNQILSLVAQTYENWQLWVRDDGSTDNTTAIVDQFAAQDCRIKRVSSDVQGVGAGRNFLSLLAHANNKFAAFCDQDDIWFEKKLEFLVEFAQNNFDEGMPSMVYCDGHAYSDVEGVITSSSISHLHAKSLREFLFFNSGYQGCSMLLNSRLVAMAREYTAEFHLHDDIISLIAHVFGEVYFLPKPLMLYRQHNQNVTGPTANGLVDIAKRFFRRGAFVVDRRHFREKRQFFLFFRSLISPSNERLFEQYFRYPQATILERLFIVMSNRFSLGGFALPLILKTLMRTPIG